MRAWNAPAADAMVPAAGGREAAFEARSPGTVADLLGAVFPVRALGWMLGPAYSGQPVLRAQQFQLLPIPRRRLAFGLFGAAFAVPRRWLSSGATAAVLVKEMRTWRRDPQRLNSLAAFAVMTCLAPTAFGSTALLPFPGALTALMAAVTSANLYAQDGTALWLTLLMPGSERADVRGRQLAWLTLFAPSACCSPQRAWPPADTRTCGRGR